MQMSVAHFACKFGETALVKLVLGTYKSDPNLKNNGKTPLHIAVEFNKVECARLLKFDYNASSDLTDYSGLLPIHYATAESFPLYMGFLGSKKGFNLHTISKKGYHRSFDESSLMKSIGKCQNKDFLNDMVHLKYRGSIIPKQKKINEHILEKSIKED